MGRGFRRARLGAGFLFAVVLASPAEGLDFAGLKAALAAAPAGAVIDVPAGDYLGQLVVDRPVVLRAAAGARLVHQGGEGGPTLWVQAAGARIENLEIDGSGEGTRRDHTAVVVTGAGVVLSGLLVRGAWAGVWIDRAEGVTVEGLHYRGLSDYPFWQRGDGVRVSASRGTRLIDLDLGYVQDGVYLETDSDTAVTRVSVADGRYGVHLMFSRQGTLVGASTRRTVAGLMAMESVGWSVRDSSFLEGFRTGSAGIRQVRTLGFWVEGCRVARQATGIELIDARSATFVRDRLEENAVAWNWGGDNSGTRVEGSVHRGNLLDVTGTASPSEDAEAHQHGALPTLSVVAPGKGPVRPLFTGNYWDAWHGWDLDGDGVGDTPYRYDPVEAARRTARPWMGLLLGSPWSLLTQSLPGGSPLDAVPRVRP